METCSQDKISVALSHFVFACPVDFCQTFALHCHEIQCKDFLISAYLAKSFLFLERWNFRIFYVQPSHLVIVLGANLKWFLSLL